MSVLSNPGGSPSLLGQGNDPEEQGISTVQHNGPKQTILVAADVHDMPSEQPGYLFFSDPNSVRSQTSAPPSAKASGLEFLGSAMDDGSGTEQVIVSMNVYRRPENIREKLIRVKVPPLAPSRPKRNLPGMTRCKGCPICPFLQQGQKVRAKAT